MDLGAGLRGGTLPSVPPNASLQVQNTALNDVINRLNSLLKTQTFSDGSNSRMLLGFQPDGWGTGKDFGIKISREGVDVTKATDDQLLFSMDLETWKFWDPSTGENYMQFGKLPDGTGGMVVAADGYSVPDAF